MRSMYQVLSKQERLQVALEGGTVEIRVSQFIRQCIPSCRRSHGKGTTAIRVQLEPCNYHIHALRHARHLLTDETARIVACSIVESRLDYCNAVVYGAPMMTINKLQRAQNNLARTVCRCSGRTDARPLLKPLHWLPIHERIASKVAVLTYKIRASSTPSYLSDLLHLVTPSPK